MGEVFLVVAVFLTYSPSFSLSAADFTAKQKAEKVNRFEEKNIKNKKRSAHPGATFTLFQRRSFEATGQQEHKINRRQNKSAKEKKTRKKLRRILFSWGFISSHRKRKEKEAFPRPSFLEVRL